MVTLLGMYLRGLLLGVIHNRLGLLCSLIPGLQCCFLRLLVLLLGVVKDRLCLASGLRLQLPSLRLRLGILVLGIVNYRLRSLLGLLACILVTSDCLLYFQLLPFQS